MRDFAEAVSPELVLVSPPDIAERARQRLPEPESQRVPQQSVRLAAKAPVANRVVEPAAVVERLPSRKRRLRRMPAVLAFLVIVAATAGVLARMYRPTDSASTSVVHATRAVAAVSTTERRPRAITHHASTTAPRPSVRRSRRHAHGATHRRTARSRALRTKAVARPPAKKLTKSAPLRVSSASKFVPARLFTWAPQQGATAYIVRFFRNGHRVLQLRAASPRVVLPSRFHFRAGVYRWQVIPLRARSGRKNLGQPIVDSAFVLKRR